jgi:TolB-like protein/Flp pilus assembly protein TadD
MLAAVLFLAAVALGGMLLWRRSFAAPPIRSIAVLPLQNLSGDPAQQYFADGMSEALIGDLSTIRGLRVISRTSAMQFKGTSQSVPQIAHTLGVDAVVEGSIVRAGNRVRVHAQLIRGPTDEHLWSASYDRELRDVLALQSEVAHAIAMQIEITVEEEQQHDRTAVHPLAPDVYDTYLKGRFALNSGRKAGAQESLGYFQTVIAKEPNFAPAYAGIAAARTELSTVFIGGTAQEERPQVVAAARKALALDPNLVEARVLLAEALLRAWQWQEAEVEYRRALALNPNSAAAHDGLAQWLLSQGRTDEALAAAQMARGLDPLAVYDRQVGWILFHSRRYESAIRELQDALAKRPEDPFTMWFLGFALIADGQAEKAVAVLERAAALTDRSPGVVGLLVYAYAAAGRPRDAQSTLAEMHRRQAVEYAPAAAFVHAYLGLGNREQALHYLQRAYEERSNMLSFVRVHPLFDPLRGDPRFIELARRVGLAEPSQAAKTAP